MSRLTRRVARGSTTVTAVALAYAGGVATGVIGSGEAPGEPVRTQVIDEAADRIVRQASHPVSRGELERAAVAGMLRTIEDPWSRYYTPTEYRAFRSGLDGRYSGVGLWLHRQSGPVEVMSVQPKSPAERAGLRTGDAILAVDGQSVADAKPGEVASALRGRPHTSVTVLVGRDGARKSLTLVRAELPIGAVEVRQADDHVMLIEVHEFARGVGRGVHEEVMREPSRHDSGVILDLRGNSGGLVDEAVETASSFLAGGPVVSYVGRGEPERRLDATGEGDTTTPLVVLVDGRTASAAEIVAGALRDRNRAVLVGSRTYGKSSVQETRRLPDGSALQLTVGRYLTPSGRDLDGVGIEPDILVPPNSPPHLAEQRALDVLNGLASSSTATDTGERG